WAPKPYKPVTKEMNFSNGGHWHYYMLNPDGSHTWVIISYNSIVEQKYFETINGFCDEQGIRNNSIPSMRMKNHFQPCTKGTQVKIEIHFSSKADLEKIVSFGFEEGFAMALDNLEELFNELKK